MPSKKHASIDREALEYHRARPAGKLEIATTKPLATQRDLSLAYSPGVAAVSRAIVKDADCANDMTSRGNLVAVISNGTAVLGLGAIGALAAKPVMEGKAALFKAFAGIDVFDIEVDERDPDKFCDIVAALEPTFCGINLEDIRAPECFEIEAALSERMKIPVFHDDQHGTAIIVAAAVMNGLDIVGKDISEVRLVCSGAGAAALACLRMLEAIGLRRENIVVVDIEGVVYRTRRKAMDKYKSAYAISGSARVLGDVIGGADIFLGLSAPAVLGASDIEKMARDPMIFAMANPDPEIDPKLAARVRPDAIVGTGRSDYPNQINNVLCFPFLFRGAIDVRATTINQQMKIACARAIAGLARVHATDTVSNAYGGERLSFGRKYLIPKPLDRRLILEIAPAVAQAAMDSGVARRPIADMDEYRKRLHEFVYRSGAVMLPIFAQAQKAPQRVAYAEGEDRRVLQAVQTVIDEGLAQPILIGRRTVIRDRIAAMGLRMRQGQDFTLVDPQSDPRFRDYWQLYYAKMGRKGVPPESAKTIVRTRNTVIGALMLERREADAMLCGTVGQFAHHLADVRDIIGCTRGACGLYAMTMLVLDRSTIVLGDTHVNDCPDVAQLVEFAKMGVQEIRQLGIEPRVAFCRIRISALPALLRWRGWARRWRGFARRIRISRSMARCKRTVRLTPSCVPNLFRTMRWRAGQIFWSCPIWTRPIFVTIWSR